MELLTNTFCAGADQRQAEIRIPSIRGQVRWWFRALGGSPEEEREIFGGVHGDKPTASKVRFRLAHPVVSRCAKNLKDFGYSIEHPQAYLLWPLRPTAQDDRKRGVLPPNTRFDLMVQHSGLSKESHGRFESALFAWMMLGSLGTRSRRGYGSVWPAKDSQFPFCLDSREKVTRALDNILGKFPQACLLAITLGQARLRAEDALNQMGKWLKEFRAGSKRSVKTPSRWGRNDHDNATGEGEILYRPVLGLPLAQRYKSGKLKKTTLKDGTDRWASPVHLKVIRCESQYYAAAVFFPEMAMPNGTRLKVFGKNGMSFKQANRGLFEAMMKPPPGGEVFCKVGS